MTQNNQQLESFLCFCPNPSNWQQIMVCSAAVIILHHYCVCSVFEHKGAAAANTRQGSSEEATGFQSVELGDACCCRPDLRGTFFIWFSLQTKVFSDTVGTEVNLNLNSRGGGLWL